MAKYTFPRNEDSHPLHISTRPGQEPRIHASTNYAGKATIHALATIQRERGRKREKRKREVGREREDEREKREEGKEKERE